MQVTKKLTEGNFYKNMLLFAIPLILSSLLSQSYSTVNGIIAGKYIDEYALGAISATGSFDTLFNSLFSGFCGGFAIYLSHLFGRGNFASIKRDIVGMLEFVAFLALGITILSIVFRNSILDYLKVDPILWKNAEIYFVIYTAGYVILFINTALINALHSLGISSFSLYVSFMSAVLNISISLLMVRVFNLGVAGLAIAANISAIAATVCYVYLLRRAFQEMSSEKVSYRFHFSCVRNSLKYSIPFAIQQLVFHGVSFVISPSINALGAATTTGYNVSQRIYLFGTQSLWATTAAFARYTGQCVGEGNVQKIRSGVRKGFRLVVTIVFPFVFFLMIFARPVISLFFPQSYSGDSFYYALRYATIYLPFVYIQLIGDFFHNYMRSLGRVNVVLGITIVGSATNIACTLLLIPYFHLEGVFIGQIISWTIDMILSFILYFYRYRTEEHLTNVLQYTV